MNNLEKNGFKDLGVYDAHLHLLFQNEIDCTVLAVKNIIDYYKYERVAILSLVQELEGKIDPCNALKSFYVKSFLNHSFRQDSVYAFGSIYHYYDENDTAESYLNQVKSLIEMGADGIKILDGKPEERKMLGKPLDDPIFDLMYQYLEENQIPIIAHVGDPAANWDITKVSDAAKERGWFYDESFPTLEQLRQETFGILRKFPKLKLCLAHFNFWGSDLQAAKQFFDTWENVMLDLTPGGEMFVGFSQKPEEWREFFATYSHRIIYGTDTYNRYYDALDEYEDAPTCGRRINLCRKMLEKSEPFQDQAYGLLNPLGLSDDVLKNIYHNNFARIAGNPKPLNFGKIGEYAQFIERELQIGNMHILPKENEELELQNLDKIKKYFIK